MKRRGWLIALCVMALMVGAFYGAATLNARQAAQEQRALLEDAITRALVTCYAVEGRYPSSLSYLEENYGEHITLETLGKLSGYVPLHILRLFRESTGQTPHEYLCSYRLLQAKKMLCTTYDSINDIALACGFHSASHFQKLFQKRFGITPNRFRKTTAPLELW